MASDNPASKEVEIDPALLRRLLTGQFPEWAGLPLRPVASAGTDNAIFRLGEDLCVRLPRLERAAGQVEKEQRWLPHLKPLPLDVPVPLGKGQPAEGYPFAWSVYGWIEGQNAILERLDDPDEAAVTLADFQKALQRVDAFGGPLSGTHNEFRGVPLAQRDPLTRVAIDSLRDLFDGKALSAVWEAALAAPPWRDHPVWIHGDIQSGNLLARAGRIRAVIDFGLLGVGDPACDLIIAWSLLPAKSRRMFRTALEVDEATWMRGRGWALSISLIALAYYLNSNPVLANISRHTIEEVLADGA